MKKSLACMIALAMLLVSLPALATETVSFPSITSADVTVVAKIQAAEGVVVKEDFAIAVAPETEEITQEITNIRAHLQEENAPLVTYFEETIQNEIKENLPDTVDVSNLVAYEVIPLAMANYEEAYGAITTAFKFATPYQDDQNVVALLGVPQGDGMQWIALPAQVVNGEVNITFDPASLKLLASGEAMLIILSEPIA